MCFIFKKNNKWTEKTVNHFLQDGASAGTRSLQTFIVIKLYQTPGNVLLVEKKSSQMVALFLEISTIFLLLWCLPLSRLNVIFTV